MGALTILVAPDSFKGSLSSVGVAQAVADGWRRVRPDDRLELAPLADGGEGTIEAVAAAGGWEWRECQVHDPIGRAVGARWLRSADGERAVVELAEASGLSRLAGRLAPLESTTRGTGEVLCGVLDAGVRRVVLGIGGSATTDGGRGLLEALGGRFDGEGVSLRADLSGLDPRLGELAVRVACDVRNPLLGPQGAAAIYGPQKGASPTEVRMLERRLWAFAQAVERVTGRSERLAPGAGAAGGVGFGLLSIADRFASFELMSGVELVMDETGFEERLRTANLVITGEGRIDEQTGFGKTAYGVASRASQAGVACVAIGGEVTEEGAACLAELGAVAIPVAMGPLPIEQAMRRSAALAASAGERLARLLALGRALPPE